MGDVHVVPRGGVWALEVAGAKFWSFDTEDKAVQRGRALAEHERGELVIHDGGKDGRIPAKNKHSHGHQVRNIRA